MQQFTVVHLAVAGENRAKSLRQCNRPFEAGPAPENVLQVEVGILVSEVQPASERRQRKLAFAP
jgi:hypothetical protein